MSTDRFTAWRQEAGAALTRRWMIGLDDAGIGDEELLRHFHDDVPAVEFAEWFARKYDLYDFSDVLVRKPRT